MRPNHFGRPTLPGESRGLLPLILGGIAVGNAIYKGISANQRKQRNKGYIQEAFRSARQKQETHEGDVRQGEAESLNARGLGTTGAVSRNPSRIAAAMAKGGIPALANLPPSTTLGGRVQTETNRELGLERRDLEQARDQALRENKAEYIDSLVGATTGGLLGLGQAYGASQDLAGMSRIQAAMQPAPAGINNPSNTWGGIDLLNPLHPAGGGGGRTFNGAGLYNMDFHL